MTEAEEMLQKLIWKKLGFDKRYGEMPTLVPKREPMKAEKRIRRIIGTMLEIMDESELETFLSAMENGVYQYIITFDMGCGNTSAAICRNGKTSYPKLLPWQYSYLDEEGKIKKVKDLSIPTIFGYDDDEPVLGPEAFLYGDAVENFKAVPNDDILDGTIFPQVGDFMDVPLRRVWKRYFTKAFDTALKAAREICPDIDSKNVIFVVAHPADSVWEENLDSYKNLIAEGTGLEKKQVITFSEAKASMQYVRVEKKMEMDWEKGVIVIDLGASTIDIEYLAYDQEPQEYSITMAGREVDRLLGHEILAQLYPEELSQLEADELPDDDFFKKHEDELGVSRRTFSWRVRNIKENISAFRMPQPFIYYTPDGKHARLTFDHIQLENLLATKAFSFNCSDPNIAAFMNAQAENEKVKQSVKDTWYQYLEKLVAYVLQKVGENGKYADKIVVTGGTANLIGIEDHIKMGVRAADWPDVETVVLNQPADYERTVPYGSASYLTNVTRNLPEILNFPRKLSEAVKEDMVAVSASIIRDSVYELAVDAVKEKIDKWAALPKKDQESSVNALKKSVGKIRISDKKLADAVNHAAIEINRYFNGAHWDETQKVINQFLNTLSIAKSYDHPISIGVIKCRLNGQKIGAVARDSFASLSIGDLIKGFWNSVAYEITNDDKPLRPSARKSLANNFSSQNQIYADLLSPIKKEFQSTFDSTEGFGIVEQVVARLETDINQAMFIS